MLLPGILLPIVMHSGGKIHGIRVITGNVRYLRYLDYSALKDRGQEDSPPQATF